MCECSHADTYLDSNKIKLLHLLVMQKILKFMIHFCHIYLKKRCSFSSSFKSIDIKKKHAQSLCTEATFQTNKHLSLKACCDISQVAQEIRE